MKDRVIVITGASGALGSVVTEMAMERGARVATIERARKTAIDTPSRLGLGGIDLVQPDQAVAAMESVADRFGRIDALINIAGAFAFETVAEGAPTTWQRLYDLNVLTALNASRAAVPHLRKSPAGRIVNLGAMGALHARAGMGPYAASKAAVHRLTEALAAELKGSVTVNAVLPSTIDTPANRTAMPDADFASWVTPAELAEVILFLSSPASGGVTAALIPAPGRV
jgi:3-oxoacyl-[acyl-carrier protein] reductase